MNKSLIIFIFIMQLSLIFAQENKVQAIPISEQKIEVDEFAGYDNLGNLYYIINNVFFKRNKTETRQYKNISFGKITKVDLQNPLKIVLFYENFNSVILLDNQLNEIQKINFSEINLPINIAATGIASQNRLWLFDSLTQQIGLYDYLKNNFQSITPSFQGSIKYYSSDFNTFQWIDENLNWLSCDIFGKISDWGKISDFDKVQVIENQIVVFSKDEKLYLQDLSKNSLYRIENIEKSFKNFYYKNQILSIFTNEGISNYKITIP